MAVDIKAQAVAQELEAAKAQLNEIQTAGVKDAAAAKAAADALKAAQVRVAGAKSVRECITRVGHVSHASQLLPRGPATPVWSTQAKVKELEGEAAKAKAASAQAEALSKQLAVVQVGRCGSFRDGASGGWVACMGGW